MYIIILWNIGNKHPQFNSLKEKYTVYSLVHQRNQVSSMDKDVCLEPSVLES